MRSISKLFRSKSSENPNSQVESATPSLQQARLLQAQGNLEEALKEFEAALRHIQYGEGTCSEQYMHVQEEVAFVHLRRGDLSAAEDGFKLHFKLRKKNMGAGNRVTLAAALNLARVYIEQKRMADAATVIQSTQKSFDEKDGGDCQVKFEAMACLGDIYTHQGRADDACTLYQRALRGLLSTVGPEARNALDTQYSLACAHALMGRYMQAVNLLKQVVERIEINTTTGDKDSLRGRSRLGRVYIRMGKAKDAEVELTSCLKRSIKLDLRKNRFVVDAANDLIELYTMQGKSEGIIAVQQWLEGADAPLPLSLAPEVLVTAANDGSVLSSTDAQEVELDPVFNRWIKIFTNDDKGDPVIALLDTACQEGNWISVRTVEKLNLLDKISTTVEAPVLQSGTGQDVVSLGAIELTWRWHPNGTRAYQAQFFVFEEGPQFDVIIGQVYITNEKLLVENKSAFVPLTEHKKSKADKSAIAQLEEKQRKEKKALEARRAAAQQATQQSSNTGASSSQQGG